MHKQNRQSGYTLVELMISLTVAMLISVAALYIFSGQVRTFFNHARKQQTTDEVQAAFEAVTTLLRQAEMCLTCATPQQIRITYPAGIANPNSASAPSITGDSISLDFSVPGGYPIWPNTTAPYTNNVMNLSWSQTTGKVQLGTPATPAVATRRRQRQFEHAHRQFRCLAVDPGRRGGKHDCPGCERGG